MQQQKHLAELGFAVLANRGRALMHHANMPMKERYKLFCEAFKAATLLDGLIPIKFDGKVKPRVAHWSGKLPNFAKHLRTWGEAGTVKMKTPTTAKLADHGVHCMFVGYTLDHAGDVYHMWNPKTGLVCTSKSQWSKKKSESCQHLMRTKWSKRGRVRQPK